MIHHKDFPFEPQEEEQVIVHVSPTAKKTSSGKISKFLVIVVFLGMIALSVKALYDFGKGDNGWDGTVRVIEPIPEPYKIKPEDPGGMDILHDDKEIYEHIKMPFEQPIDIYSDREDPIADLIANSDKIPSSQIAKPLPKPEVDVFRPKKPEPKIVTINGEKSTIAPSNMVNTINQLTGGEKRIEVDKVLAKKLDPEIWLQLGTFKSEQDATKAWQDVREKNTDILGTNGIKVTKSDNGPQGITYRLQSGPIASEDEAKLLCGKLNQRQLSCFHTITYPR